MIAADDFASGAAEISKERDVRRRIDFEPVGLLCEIWHRMQRGDTLTLTIGESFNKPAAFSGICALRFVTQLLLQR